MVNGLNRSRPTSSRSTIRRPVSCWRIAPIPRRQDVDAAVKSAAKAAFDEWRSTPVLVRAQYMHHFKVMVEENFEKVSQIVVREHGKTMDEARGEVRRGIESIDFAMSVPVLMRSDGLEDISSGIDETTVRQPAGVFAAITPFNFPFHGAALVLAYRDHLRQYLYLEAIAANTAGDRIASSRCLMNWTCRKG